MSNPWDARNFYHFMKVTGTTGTYEWSGSRHFIAKPSDIALKPENPYNQTVFPQGK